MSYNSKRIGLSGRATGPSPVSGSIGRTSYSGSFSIAFPFFTEDFSLREAASFMDLTCFTEHISPSNSPTSAMGLADSFAVLITASKNSCSFFSCYLTFSALDLHFTSWQRAVISAFMAMLEFRCALISACFVWAARIAVDTWFENWVLATDSCQKDSSEA